MTTSTRTLGVARPAGDFDAIAGFYRDGLGLQVIASFDGHDGADGVMPGHPRAP